MRASNKCLDLIKEREGFSPTWYMDENDGWTIGYGHLRKTSDKHITSLTEEEAEALLREDVRWAENAVNNYVTVPLTQGQFDALVSFVYNVGPDAFKQSTLLRLLNRKSYDLAAKQFGRWVYDDGKKLKGLEIRREKERLLFVSVPEGTDTGPNHTDPAKQL